jgi:6-pyruvoyltetrahydropterin/6-carboxytetrahydropterin synthase
MTSPGPLKLRFLEETFMLTITRKLEFDAGHRIPDHKSQCRNLHGHRYTLEITLTGAVIDVEGNSDNGMIMDFSDIKARPRTPGRRLGPRLPRLRKGRAGARLPGQPAGPQDGVIDRIPTVENLAREAFAILEAAYKDATGTGLHLHKLVLHETPNCWARSRQTDGRRLFREPSPRPTCATCAPRSTRPTTLGAGRGAGGGTVVVKDGVVIATGFNQPIGKHDPTAHAEINGAAPGG